MSTAPPPIPYASPRKETCPLCHQRPVWKKSIYGHPVCKKCYYAFANRRQLAYVIDALVFLVPIGFINYLFTMALDQARIAGLGSLIAQHAIAFALACLFLLKDGFHGYSPGKKAMDLQVLDQITGQPIGFAQSFKRNAILLLGQIPFAGPLVALIVILVIATQLARGYRIGDRFANTRVIWKKFARLYVFGGTDLLCESCGYDLQGNLSGVCPECGTAISDRNAAQLSALTAS